MALLRIIIGRFVDNEKASTFSSTPSTVVIITPAFSKTIVMSEIGPKPYSHSRLNKSDSFSILAALIFSKSLSKFTRKSFKS